MNKKDLKVEIFRIVAIFLVILQHSLPGFLSKTNNLYLGLDALSSMSVCIFFVISGFFMYQNKQWRLKIKDYIFNILIPMLIVAFFVLVFESFIMKQKNFFECLITNDYIKILKKFLLGIRQWSNVPWGFVLGHMWFVFTYGIIILFYPITNYFVNKLNKKIIFLISFLYLIYMIIILNVLKLDAKKYHYLDVVFISVYGHILYNEIFPILNKKIKNLKNKIIGIFSLGIIWCLIFYIICHFQKQIYTVSFGRMFISYNSGLMVLLTIVTISMMFLILKDIKINKKILMFSEKTYLIYLLHDDIIVLAMQYGIYNLFLKRMNNSINTIFYTLLFIVDVYVFTFGITAFLYFVKKNIKEIYKKFKNLYKAS